MYLESCAKGQGWGSLVERLHVASDDVSLIHENEPLALRKCWMCEGYMYCGNAFLSYWYGLPVFGRHKWAMHGSTQDGEPALTLRTFVAFLLSSPQQISVNHTTRNHGRYQRRQRHALNALSIEP